MAKVKTNKDQIREAAEASLESFIRLVHPKRVLGNIHREICTWWDNAETSHQILLMPRDHQKSALIGYRVAQEICRNPSVRILYISSTANLAVKQLKFIKDILTSPIVSYYWPGLVNPQEAQREKWTETEISVDHQRRKDENIRDPTVFTAGLTTTITGLHCDIQVMDDVVVRENAYTEEGRQRTREQYSLLASIASGDGKQWVVGTRYHPKDLYNDLSTMTVDTYDDHGDLIGDYRLYDFKEYEVENRGDGTGEFLWPRQRRSDGHWFGFNADILAKKRAQYLDKTQFRAQYYNDPNDIEGGGIPRENFQYYDRGHLSRSNGFWYIKGRRLNLFAAVDFAYSLRQEADYSAIVVVGIDSDHNYYVLDIDRFKTKLNSEYFSHILALHQKWDFRKLKAETTAAQKTIVEDLKLSYIRPHGLALVIEDHTPTRSQGSKEERIAAALQARYANGQIWHYSSGHCQTLEEELTSSHPAHDDLKDCLAVAVEACVAPSAQRQALRVVVNNATRFGGF